MQQIINMKLSWKKLYIKWENKEVFLKKIFNVLCTKLFLLGFRNCWTNDFFLYMHVNKKMYLIWLKYVTKNIFDIKKKLWMKFKENKNLKKKHSA